MDFHYTDYVITQTGAELSTPAAIKLQKYENRVSRLVFQVEDWLSETARLYVAILNPETKRYHYEPLLQDDDGSYYMIIGTSITYYPGKTKLLLIGVTPEFELDDNITLSPEATIYVSREFPRIVVLENFLDDDAMELTFPNLDQILDNLVVLHDNTVTIALQTAQDLVDCNEALAQCEADMAKCDDDMAQCDADLARCEEILTECTELAVTCEADKDECNALLEQNTAISGEVTNLLAQTQEVYNQCVTARNNCNNAVTSCNAAASSASESLSRCQSILTQCQQQLTAMQTLRNTMTTQYNNYMASMQQTYNEIIESIRNEGGEP